MFKKTTLILTALILPQLLLAQAPENADALRANGKIYVVVVVVSVILVGVIGFLVYLERQLNKATKN